MPEERVPSAQLVPKKVVVHARHPYTAVRYVTVSPAVTKKRIEEYLAEREKESRLSRYLRRKPMEVDIYSPAELERMVEPTRTGERYFSGVNIKNIKRVISYRKPEELGGYKMTVCLKTGENVHRYEDKLTEKRQKKKFRRAKNVATAVKDLKDRYRILLRSSDRKERQLGAVLALMEQHDVRVGSGMYGVEEAPIKVGDLKRGMVVIHSSWPPGSPPHVVVEEKTPEGIKKVFLRSIEKQEEAERLADLRRQVKVLSKRIEKEPTEELKLELGRLKVKADEIAERINKPIPPKWTDLVRLGHYGATQLEARHVKYPAPGEIWLDFIGKSAQRWKFRLKDTNLAEVIKELQRGKAGSDMLFPDVRRIDVAKILRRYHILPKDIRTYEGTSSFMEESKNHPVPTSKKELRRIRKEIFKAISKKLVNKPGVAKKAYVDPSVTASWETGLLKIIEKEKGIKKSLFVILIGGDKMGTLATERMEIC